MLNTTLEFMNIVIKAIMKRRIQNKNVYLYTKVLFILRLAYSTPNFSLNY